MGLKKLIKCIAVVFLTLNIFFRTSIIDAAFSQGEMTTLAGSGELGYEDGLAKMAQFSLPSNAIESSDGLIYVSDTNNHRVRMITIQKSLETFAGMTTNIDSYNLPVGGFRDGLVHNAMFRDPKGLAISENGMLYIVDSGNNAIRSIDASGIVKTVTAKLNTPSDIVIGKKGELFVSDTLNHRIVKINDNGDITVVAGGKYELKNDGVLVGGLVDGKGELAKFNEPTGLAIDGDGNLYVADTGNQRIRKIDTNGNVTTIAGSGAQLIEGTNYIEGSFKDGNGVDAQFNFPSGLAIDNHGNLFVADTFNHVVRVIASNGQVDTVAGVVGESGNEIGNDLLKVQFDQPTDVTVLKNGHLMVVDQGNNKVRELIFDKKALESESENLEEIYVKYQDSLIEFTDAKPKIESGRTMIPLRTISETFGYVVSWDEENQEITLKGEEQLYVLKIGETTVKGSKQFVLDVPPTFDYELNRTYVPLNFMVETFHYKVDWIESEKTVVIH